MSSNNAITTDKTFTTPTASWFKPTITLEEIPKPALDLLMSCTGLPHDKIVSHVNDARAAAWLTAPYPCIGLYMFLDLHMSQHSLYPDILSRLNNSPAIRLLDVGCGLGQDVRKLVFDGVPAKQIYAVELKAGLISAGHDLFMDGGKEGITFLQGDAVNDDIRSWKKNFQIEEGFEIIHTGALFHLFTWETQLTIAKNLVELVHGKDEAVIFGWTFAAHEAGLRSVGPNKEAKVYGHNEESARRFWEEVGEVTGTEWEWEIEVRFAWADVGEAAGLAKGGSWGDADGNGMMWFSVRRV